MIKHITKSGAVSDIAGRLVKRIECPTAYTVMERIYDNSRQTDGGKTACQEIQIPGEKGKVSNDERAVDGMR